MINFNQLEKEITTAISKINIESNETFSRFLQDKYFTKKRNEILLIKHDTKEVVLYVKPDVYDDDKKRPKAIKELWILISLMEYLIEKRYVMNIPIKNKVGINIIYSEFDAPSISATDKLLLSTNDDYLIPSKPDIIYNSKGEIIFKGFLINDVYENITDNLLNIAFPTTDLKELVKHNFQSYEDRKYKRQLSLTWLGIILSIIIGGYGIFFNIQESRNNIPFQNSIINKFDYLIQEVNKKNIIENEISKHDTTNLKIHFNKAN